MIPLLLLVVTSAILILLMVFNYFTRVEAAGVDIHFLQEKNLYALHVLKIVESADYQFYSKQNRKYRQFLFLSYARNLKKDVDELSATRLGGQAYGYYLLFKLSYLMLLLKSRIFGGADDLRVLLGIELMMIKTLHPSTS